MTDFDTFWKAYPRNTAKVIARRAFDKAITKIPLSAMLHAIGEQAQTDQWRRGVIPHAATWLRQERWRDELPRRPVTRHVVTTAPEAVDADRAARLRALRAEIDARDYGK